jgi:hypothetical protein
MKLEIQKIEDKGNHEKERIVLKALIDEQIGNYLVLSTQSKGDNNVSTLPDFTFWLPDISVKANDLVVIYTKKGIQSSKPFKDNVSHFIYWGLDSAIWNSPNSKLILLHTDGIAVEPPLGPTEVQ